jgi:hypothetical protein
MLSAPERFQDFEKEPLKAFVNRCISTEAKDRPSSARECFEEISRLGRVDDNTGNIPGILVGSWDHQWDSGLRSKAVVTISDDGSYVARTANGLIQFRLANAIYSEETREVRFDLIKADGIKDSTQLLRVEGPNLLDGAIEGDASNQRRYTRKVT